MHIDLLVMRKQCEVVKCALICCNFQMQINGHLKMQRFELIAQLKSGKSNTNQFDENELSDDYETEIEVIKIKIKALK